MKSDAEYTSYLEDYPGSITFVEPFLGSHYRLYYNAIQKAGKDQYEKSPRMKFWQGAIAQNGDVKIIEKWDLKGLERPEPDSLGDDLPIEVIVFIVDCVDDYIGGKLSLALSPKE